MAVIERSIQVEYPLRVYFTRNVFAPGNPLLAGVLAGPGGGRQAKVLVMLDAGLAGCWRGPDLPNIVKDYFSAHATRLSLVCPPAVMAGGEQAKNSLRHVSEIHSLVDRHHLDRHSYVVGVGGGALLDVAGFAAATAHRGLRHVRLPTTTLSQADSGVGVKNGLNAFGKKNFIGTFAPPTAVINDFEWLGTLPPRQRRAGYAEAVKVACIRDRGFFDELERDAARLKVFEPACLERVIVRCAELHLDHIAASGDPFETGTARPLDFGHWAAHKLEQLSHFSLAHGEAVAIGIALDVIYSRNCGLLDAASAERILALLQQLGFRLFTGELSRPDLLEGLEEFREHIGGDLSITLLKRIGEGVDAHEMDPGKIAEAVAELARRPAPAG